MGKKRIIQKTKEELLAEKEKVEQALKKEVKAKTPKRVQEGKVYISSSYNNTIITLADPQGNVLAWSSAGNVGFRGTKKATPWAASRVVEVIARVAQKLGIERIQIFVKGIGSSRESAIRSLGNKGFDILSITDVTPIPHNGCRPPKARRV